MRLTQKIVVWLQFSILLLTSMSNRCDSANDIEPIPSVGFDFQIFISANNYRSLYVHTQETDFVFISQGKRVTGIFTQEEHKNLLDLLRNENQQKLMTLSVLESDSIVYPYLSIRSRAANTTADNADFFVILPLNLDEKLITDIVLQIENIFTKYQE